MTWCETRDEGTTDLECLESSASIETAALLTHLQSGEHGHQPFHIDMVNPVAGMTDLWSAGGFTQLRQQVRDGPDHVHRLARPSTIEQESHCCYIDWRRSCRKGVLGAKENKRE